MTVQMQNGSQAVYLPKLLGPLGWPLRFGVLAAQGGFVLCFVRLASAKCTLDMFVSDYRML
jgi:hypothetical protein